MATINKHRNDEAPKLVGIRSAVVVAEAVPLSRESGDGAVERERERSEAGQGSIFIQSAIQGINWMSGGEGGRINMEKAIFNIQLATES